MIAIPSVHLHGSGQTTGASTNGRARVQASGLARQIADLGFARLHVENGASSAASMPTLEDLLRDTAAQLQVAGVGTTTDIELLLRAGAESVVVGDRAIEEPDWLADVAELYPDSVVVATDVRDRRVMRRGWVRTLPVDILDLVDELNALPLRELLVTVRPHDGALRFGELGLLEDVVDRSRCPVLVAGAVTSIQDLRALEHRGVAGAIIEAERLLGATMDGRQVAREFGA